MEPRRVEMVTFVQQNVPKSEKVEPTIRFMLTLTESNDETCPEFSYAELWKNALDEKGQDENDPFSKTDRAEDDKMAALAKSFEAKYGPPPARKKSHRRSDRMQDLVDLGDGYDETDPFVDNSEAYDEIVPASVTTKHGGFYINAGCLDFRALSDDSSDAFREQKYKKKHRILSDSESDGIIKKRGRPKKKKLLEGVMGEEMKKRKWKRIATTSDAAKNFIRRKKLKAKELATAAQALSAPSLPVPGQNGIAHPRKPVIVNSSDNESNSAFDTEMPSTLDPETSAKYESVIDSVISQASPEEIKEKTVIGMEEMVPKLPSPLSDGLHDAIAKIKQAAKESAEGKCKFFNLRVNELLLQIENESRQLACGVRMSIYSHLAGHLPCGKETLVKRAKKLRLNQQDHKLREPLARLREAISLVMPALLEKHQAECHATAQAKERMSETKEKVDGVQESGSTESEEDGEKSQDGTGEKQKRIVAPRRKFAWNAEIRHLLCNVVRIKMECFELSKIRSQNPEEYLRAFLDAEVKPLWPQGWMQTRMLFKETRCIHMRWTNPALQKPKKSMLLPSTPKLNIQTPGGVNTSVPPVSELLHIFTSSLSAVSTLNATAASKTDERSPGGGKCEEVDEKPSPLRSAPTLLDYASQSFMSAARSKTLSSGANESNSDAGMPSPSMPRLKPEKPVAPPESQTARRVIMQDVFLDHFKAFTQQQLINKAKSLIKPGGVTNIPQGGTVVETAKVAPPAVSAHAVKYTTDQMDNRLVTPTAPSGGVNSTNTKMSPTNLPHVMSPTSVAPRRNVTPPRQVVTPPDHFLSQKDLAHADDRLSSAELANLLLRAGNKPKQVMPSSDRQMSPKNVDHIGDRLSSVKMVNLVEMAINKRQMSATMSPRGHSTGSIDGSTMPQVQTSQVKSAAVPGSNTMSWLQQPQHQGYLSGERTVTGQSKGVQGGDLKQRSPSGQRPPGQRSPVSARQTEPLTSTTADGANEKCTFASGSLRWPSEGAQSHDGRDRALTSGEKKRQPMKLQRQCSVGLDQVSHGMVAPPSGIAKQTSVSMQHNHTQELSCTVAPSGGVERQTPVMSSGQQKRRNSVTYGQEMHHTTSSSGMERQSSVSPGASSQSSASVTREHRTSLDRRRLSLTPPTLVSSQQRSPAIFSSSPSPRQQHGCDRLSHIGGGTVRQQQQPSYGGLSLTEAHQQVLAANQNSYIKQALSMAPPESWPNHGDTIPMSHTSTCSSPLYWSTPLSHSVGGSPRTSLPTPVFTPTGPSSDRGASLIATTAAMFSLPGDVPPRSSVGYLGLSQLSLPKVSPPHLSHPTQQHPTMHLNGSPDQISGNNIYGHASTPHGSPLSVRNAQGMTSQHGGAHCFSPRHPPPPAALMSFGNPFSDPNQPQHHY